MAKNEMGRSNRINYIDIAKGIAILLVIIGHCSFCPSELRSWLYSFHMPLFFALSGMTFSSNRYESFGEFLIKKIKSLMIPYYILCFLLLIFVTLLSKDINVNQFIFRFENIFIANRLHRYFSMWFIPALFFSEILFYWVVRLFERKHSKVVLVVLSLILTLIGFLIFKKVKGFYYSIDTVPIALAFLIIGYLLKSFSTEIEKKSKCVLIGLVSLVVNTLCALINYLISHTMTDIYYCKIGNPFIFWLSAVSGIIFVLTVSFFIQNCFLLEYFGKNTLVFYAFQNSFVLPICEAVFVRIKNSFSILDNTVFALLFSVVLSCVILSIMSEVIKRILPIAVGKSIKQKNSK